MKESVKSSLVEILKTRIEDGTYVLSQKLPSELKLCAELDVSRTTLREAFQILSIMGYVELKPGKGAFVSAKKPANGNIASEWLNLNKCDIIDIIEVRQAVEPYGAKLAAARIDDLNINALYGLIYHFEKACCSNDIAGMVKYDEEFHGHIIKNAGNKVLFSIYKSLVEKLHDYRNGIFSIADNGFAAIAEHKAIADAIVKRNEEGVFNAMLLHIEKVKSNVDTLCNL